MPKEIIGTPFFTPSEVAQDLVTLHNEITTLHDEISFSPASDSLGPFYEKFVTEWTIFYDKVKDSTIMQSLNSTYDKLKEFKERFKAWRTKFLQEGHASVTYAFPSGSGPFKMPLWGWLAAAGVAGYGLIKLITAQTRYVGVKTGYLRAKAGKPKSHKKGLY